MSTATRALPAGPPAAPAPRSAPSGRRSGPAVAPVVRRPWVLRHASRFVLAELAAIVAVLMVLGGQLWQIVAGSVLLVLLLVLAVPVFGGRSLVDLVRLRGAYARRRPVPVRDPAMPHALAPLAEWVPGLTVSQTVTGRGEELGMIADGTAWCALLALESDDEVLADAGEELDLVALGELTVQDDILFDAIQVVTYTVPAPASVVLGEGSAIGTSYAELGDLPPALRLTWLSLRLDPARSLAAVTRRGDGGEGIQAALRFGLHRVQSALKRQGIVTRALGPTEIVDVLSLTCGAGLDGDASGRETWRHWSCDGLLHAGRVVRGWGANPSLAYARLLDAVTSAPVLCALTSFTLTPSRQASGAIRLVVPDSGHAAAAEAYLHGRLGSDVRLAPPGGTQVPAMLATVPLGRLVRT